MFTGCPEGTERVFNDTPSKYTSESQITVRSDVPHCGLQANTQVPLMGQPDGGTTFFPKFLALCWAGALRMECGSDGLHTYLWVILRECYFLKISFR